MIENNGGTWIGAVHQNDANHHVCELDALADDGACHSTYHNLDPVCLQAFPKGGKFNFFLSNSESSMVERNLKKNFLHIPPTFLPYLMIFPNRQEHSIPK